MSGPGPEGGGSPLERLPFFAELAGVPDVEGPVHWDVARRVAVWVTSGGRFEPPVEPSAVVQLEQFGRVAELHVADAARVLGGPAVPPVAVAGATRGEWAVGALDAHAGLFEALAVSLAGGRPRQADDRPGGLAPSVLEALVFGSMVGQLARRSLGHHDPPLPRPPSGRLSIVVTNLDDIAVEWGLPVDEVRLWACLRDVARAAVLGVPHVSEALTSRLRSYAGSFDIPPDALAEEIEEVDPADPTSFRAALGDPDHLLAGVQTPAQAHVLAQLEALTAVVEGWVDQVVDGIGRRLLPSYPSLEEAVRRRRAEATWGDRYVARLLGIGLRQPAYERGRHFIEGVRERAGEEALGQLWASPRGLPTPAEVDAPGLWLARLELPELG